MIVLDRQKPLKLQILEAMLRRLPIESPDFPMYSERLRQVKAGYAGEKRVDMEWKEIRYPGAYYLLHDALFINEMGSTHQMDTIFICQNFTLIVEIKNIKGRIDFDDQTHQCIRTHSTGEVEGLPSGVNQILRHRDFLKAYFHRIGLSMPVEVAIIFAYPSSIIGTISQKVRAFNVVGLSEEMVALYNKHTQAVLDKNSLKKVVSKLLKSHKPGMFKNEFEASKLRKGVLCANCEYQIRMIYQKGKWCCPKCHTLSDYAFYEALYDYRLLEGEVISNRILREYFGLPNRNIATKVLVALHLESRGSNKCREYFIPANILDRGLENKDSRV